MNGVLLIMFVLACIIGVDGRKLYEFLAVTKVDGLPPAPSLDGSFGTFWVVENYVCKI